MALADRFSSIEELSACDESQLTDIGITNQVDRNRLIEQARLLSDKVNYELNHLSFFYKKFSLDNSASSLEKAINT